MKGIAHLRMVLVRPQATRLRPDADSLFGARIYRCLE
jgi:hypothetical protein